MGAKRKLSKVFSRMKRSDSSKEHGPTALVAAKAKEVIARSTRFLPPPSPVSSLPGEINIYCVSPGHSAVSLVTYDDTVHKMESPVVSARQQPLQMLNNNVSSGQIRSSSTGISGTNKVQQKVKMPVSRDLAPLLPDLAVEDEEPLLTLSTSAPDSEDTNSFIKPRVIAAFPARDFPMGSPPATGRALEQALGTKPSTLEKEDNRLINYHSPSNRRGKKTATNMLTRTQLFEQICDNVFDELDVNGSGSIEKRDLYSGLLLVHLQLSSFVGPIACKPVSRTKVDKLLLSRYNVGERLYRDEFKDAMVLLTSSLLGRMLMQWTIILVFVPYLARHISEKAFFFVSFILSPWLKQRNEPIYLRANQGRWVDEDLSSKLGHCLAYIWHQIQMIPDSTWRAVLLTAVTCVLGLILVPWFLAYAESQAPIGSTSTVKRRKLG